MAVCGVCGKEKVLGDKELYDWQMQHLHVEEGELKLLTCDKCKLLSPMEHLRRAAKVMGIK